MAAVLEATKARGQDVDRLLSRTLTRATNAQAFTAACRRYVWPTDGLHGIQLAPFQLLASEGKTWSDHDHSWHLALADRLVAAAPGLIRNTKRRLVDTSDPTSVDAGVRWWENLTGAGGEGMVVKPLAKLVKANRGYAQPGTKVRGREYLRIVYGPDYTEAANLERLRSRGLGLKRSLTARKYALGIESLERAARREPLWRNHEPVFAVLALESEPVDPRLQGSRSENRTTHTDARESRTLITADRRTSSPSKSDATERTPGADRTRGTASWVAVLVAIARRSRASARILDHPGTALTCKNTPDKLRSRPGRST